MNLCSMCTWMLRSPEHALTAPPSHTHPDVHLSSHLNQPEISVGWGRQWNRVSGEFILATEATATVTRSSIDCSIVRALCWWRQVGELQPLLFSHGRDSSCSAFLCSCLFSKPGILVFLEILWAFQQPFNRFLFCCNQPASVSVTCN